MEYIPTNNSRMNEAQWSSVTAVAVAASSSWLRRAQQKLRELSELRDNWDSYGSRPIQQKASETAAELLTETAKFGLPEPQIFPVPGGGLQLEWDNAKCELELGILPDGEMEFLITDSKGEMLENRISPSWMGEIYRLANWFVNQRDSINDF
ncbi:MAG: hypothetical protein WKF90_00015 [Pyrinomonadaceae bacterium]